MEEVILLFRQARLITACAIYRTSLRCTVCGLCYCWRSSLTQCSGFWPFWDCGCNCDHSRLDMFIMRRKCSLCTRRQTVYDKNEMIDWQMMAPVDSNNVHAVSVPAAFSQFTERNWPNTVWSEHTHIVKDPHHSVTMYCLQSRRGSHYKIHTNTHTSAHMLAHTL